MELVFGRSQHGVLHPQVAVVGIDTPRVRNSPGNFGLDAAVFDPRLVEQFRTAVDLDGLDDVASLDPEEVDAVRHAPFARAVTPGHFVVPDTLGLQVGVLHAEHIEILDRRVAEALACRSLQHTVAHGLERDAGLRHPDRTAARVPVVAHAGIEGEAPDPLPQFGIAGHLVLPFVDDRRLAAVDHRTVPGLADDVLPVDTGRQPAAAPECQTLVERHPEQPVARVETLGLRLFAGFVSVVDAVTAPVVVEFQRSGGMFVVILEGQRGHAARDARIVVEERRRDRSRIRGVEVGDVDVGRGVPVVRDLVAQFGESAVLFEAHVGAVAVRTVVRSGNNA